MSFMCPDCMAPLRGDGSCCDVCNWTWKGGGGDPRDPSGRSNDEIHAAIVGREDSDLAYHLARARAKDLHPRDRVVLLQHVERLARDHVVNATRRWRSENRSPRTSDDLEHRYMVLDAVRVELATARAALDKLPNPATLLGEADLDRAAQRTAVIFLRNGWPRPPSGAALRALAHEAAEEGHAGGPSSHLQGVWNGEEFTILVIADELTLRAPQAPVEPTRSVNA